MPKSKKPMTYDDYMNRRSWLVDTAETPEDKKNLKEDLKKLDRLYKESRREGGITTSNGVRKVNPVYRNVE